MYFKIIIQTRLSLQGGWIFWVVAIYLLSGLSQKNLLDSLSPHSPQVKIVSLLAYKNNHTSPQKREKRKKRKEKRNH